MYIDLPLTVGVGDTGETEKSGQEVGDETVTRELTVDGHQAGTEQPVPVGAGGNELGKVPELLVGTREGDGLFDFSHGNPDHGRVDIVVARVELGQDGSGLLALSVGVEVSRGFRGKDHSDDVQHGGETLDEHGRSPRPVAVHSTGGDGDTRGEDLTNVVEGVQPGRGEARQTRGFCDFSGYTHIPM